MSCSFPYSSHLTDNTAYCNNTDIYQILVIYYGPARKAFPQPTLPQDCREVSFELLLVPITITTVWLLIIRVTIYLIFILQHKLGKALHRYSPLHLSRTQCDKLPFLPYRCTSRGFEKSSCLLKAMNVLLIITS